MHVKQPLNKIATAQLTSFNTDSSSILRNLNHAWRKESPIYKLIVYNDYVNISLFSSLYEKKRSLSHIIFYKLHVHED